MRLFQWSTLGRQCSPLLHRAQSIPDQTPSLGDVEEAVLWLCIELELQRLAIVSAEAVVGTSNPPTANREANCSTAGHG